MKNKIIKYLKRNVDIIIVAEVLALIIVSKFFLAHFYYSAVNFYIIKLLPIILFGLMVALAIIYKKNERFRKRIFLILLVFFIFFEKGQFVQMILFFSVMMAYAGIFVIIGVAILFLSGWLFGKFIKNKFNLFNVYEKFKWCVVSIFLLNCVLVGVVIVYAETCETNGCFHNKAMRYDNKNICSKIIDESESNNSQFIGEKKECFDAVLKKEKYNNKNLKACDDVINKKDKEICYFSFAERVLDTGICNNFIKDKKRLSRCKKDVELKKCYNTYGNKEWKKRDDCKEEILKKARLEENKIEKNTANQGNYNSIKSMNARYKEIYAEEERNGDVFHKKSKRFSDISQLKRVAESMQRQAKKCDDRGEIINSSGKDKMSKIMCNNSNGFNWSTAVDACGVQGDIWWIVVYDNSNWDFTLECTKYPECSGIENVKCNKDDCWFSDNCNEE